MKIFRFADRVRTLVIALGLAVAASFGASQAYAAEKVDAAAQALADAPAIIATAKIDCDPSAAKVLGDTNYTKADNSKVKGKLYEIACKAGPGFIITVISPTEVYQPFTCLLADGVHAKQPNSVTCTLPQNTPSYGWLQPVAQTYLPGCVVTGARVVGSTTEPPLIDRYEVQCKDAVGGMIDYAQLAQPSATDFKPCLMEASTKSPCTLTTPEQITAAMAPIAAAADKDCQVNNVRFVGITNENDAYYYEFGCSNKPGFMVQTGLDNSFRRMITCATAAGLGGCQFTSAGTAAADAKSTYSDQLKAAGFPCTVQDYDVKGSQPQTKRDFIEFKCAEQPFGLLGFIPEPDSVSSLHVYDCFQDQVNKDHYCTYVTTTDLMKQWDKLIKIAKPDKGCDVTQVRYIGESETVDGGVVAELACANKRGYLAVIAGDRQSLLDAEPCTIAKAHNEENQCTIPGNGTYASPE